MTAFRARLLTANRQPVWGVEKSTDGSEWAPVLGLPFYATSAEAEAMAQRLDQLENGGGNREDASS
jgi:hypothetical protein